MRTPVYESEEYPIDYDTLVYGRGTDLICITDQTDQSDVFVIQFTRGAYWLGRYYNLGEFLRVPNEDNKLIFISLGDALKKKKEVDDEING